MADELLARVDALGRRFDLALDLGCHDGRLGRALPAARVAFADSGFDLIVSAGSLHGVNDLPGALIQLRRALRPGGLFLATFPAGDSLAEIRRAFVEAEAAIHGGAAARVLPMVDPAEAAGLLQRAGFVGPVADSDTRTVRYRDLFAALADLRGAGETAILAPESRAALSRAALIEAARRFALGAGPDGRIDVRVALLTLTAWAPGDAGAIGEALKQRL